VMLRREGVICTCCNGCDPAPLRFTGDLTVRAARPRAGTWGRCSGCTPNVLSALGCMISASMLPEAGICMCWSGCEHGILNAS